MRQVFLMAMLLCISSPIGAQNPVKCGQAFAAANGQPTGANLKTCVTRCTGVGVRATDLTWCAAQQAKAASTPGQQVSAASPNRPALHFIPAGTFEMGSPKSEEGRDDDETQHTVTLTRPFLMMRTEVTQAQWAKVMGSSPSHFKDCADCPVEQVSWYDAVAYANALSEREGKNACYAVTACTGTPGAGCDSGAYCPGDYQCTVEPKRACSGYRLPTEAEWEYAARAGTTEARHGPLDAVAWHGGNSGNKTHPAGQKTKNTWGLHDMLGNVYEWTGDWKADYSKGKSEDPRGPPSGGYRVVRGGSFRHSARWARSAYRFGSVPVWRYLGQGFRLVRPQLDE